MVDLPKCWMCPDCEKNVFEDRWEQHRNTHSGKHLERELIRLQSMTDGTYEYPPPKQRKPK